MMMSRKIMALAIVFIFVFASIGAYASASETAQPTAQPLEKTKDRASRAMNNLLYGPTEVAGNLDESNTKGTKIDRCTEKTRGGVERGIGRIFAGVWQMATFWYSDPDCVTSTKGGPSK